MNDKLASFLTHASDIAIAGVATAAGAAVAGPDNAVVGSMVGQTVTGVLGEFAHRVLSARETQRVLATVDFTCAEISRRLGNGEEPRTDGFFDRRADGRSKADEIFEGVLLKTKADHEEKKARCYSRVFTTVAFEPAVSHATASYYLHLTDELTYTQLVLLELFSEPERFQLRKVEYTTVSPDQLAAIAAVFELFRMGMLRSRYKDPTAQGSEYLLEMNGVRPAHMYLTPLGMHIRIAAGLKEIDQRDLCEMAALLSDPTK